MVISASDGWTLADAIIYDRIWGTEGILRRRRDPTGGVLAGPMASPSEPASVTTVCILVFLSCFSYSCLHVPSGEAGQICTKRNRNPDVNPRTGKLSKENMLQEKERNLPLCIALAVSPPGSQVRERGADLQQRAARVQVGIINRANFFDP